jgi:PAS domain S-box-containing protein
MSPFLDPETADAGFALKHCTIPVAVLLTALVLGITVLCVSAGYVTIFQNMYYLPIIMFCTNFPRKGMLYTSFLSTLYLILLVSISADVRLVIPGLIRVVFFHLIGISIVMLTRDRLKAEGKLLDQKENLNRVISEQTSCIQRELEQSQRLERAFREANEYYERLFTQLKAPILFWNNGFYITRTNTAFEELVGQPKTELIGRKLSTILPITEEDIRMERSPVAYPVQRSDGSTRHILWTFSEIMKSDGISTGVFAVGQEITLAD